MDRKAAQYIFAQIFGGYIAVLCVYGQYKQEIDAVYEGIMAASPSAAVADATIFSPFGPAGILAIYPTPGQLLRYVFLVSFLLVHCGISGIDTGIAE